MLCESDCVLDLGYGSNLPSILSHDEICNHIYYETTSLECFVFVEYTYMINDGTNRRYAKFS